MTTPSDRRLQAACDRAQRSAKRLRLERVICASLATAVTAADASESPP